MRIITLNYNGYYSFVIKLLRKFILYIHNQI